jgi:two-component system, cell cycle sensor histidine kinase and response regulator CckA
VPGEGTAVSVLLPAAESAPTEPQAPERVGRGRGETILVVEDEENVRRLAARLLEAAGYEVLEAGGLSEALDACDGGSRTIDLLLTDVVLPEASGPEVAERLHEQQPDMRVLLTSGYGDEVLHRHGVDGEGAAFLTKPFTRDTLLRAVAAALARAGRPAAP